MLQRVAPSGGRLGLAGEQAGTPQEPALHWGKDAGPPLWGGSERLSPCFSTSWELTYWLSGLQVLQGAEPVGGPDRVRPVQGAHQPVPRAGVCLAGVELDRHEGGAGAGETFSPPC